LEGTRGDEDHPLLASTFEAMRSESINILDEADLPRHG